MNNSSVLLERRTDKWITLNTFTPERSKVNVIYCLCLQAYIMKQNLNVELVSYRSHMQCRQMCHEIKQEIKKHIQLL